MTAGAEAIPVTSLAAGPAPGPRLKVEIVPVETRTQRKAFIRLPWSLYADDPNWVPPLLMEEQRRIGPDAPPGHRMWIARVDGRTVGRISAQLPADGVVASAEPSTGRFGWIEAIDAPEVFEALFGTAESWLRDQGMARCLGPFNFTVNDECGLLVDGFDTPPMIMMPHSKPYYAARLAGVGYDKAMDLLAYRIDTRQPLPRRAEKIRQWAEQDPAVVLRQPDYRKFEDEVATVLNIFNDAWSGNWGFEPFSPEHISDMAKALRPILPPPATCIAEYEGRPVAFALGLPNINEIIRNMNGRLLPFNWLSLLYRIKFGRFSSGRLALMGVRKEFQTTPMGAALAVAVIDRLRTACLKHKVHTAELSWVLETNRGVRTIIEAFGGQPYKTYRIFSRNL